MSSRVLATTTTSCFQLDILVCYCDRKWRPSTSVSGLLSETSVTLVSNRKSGQSITELSVGPICSTQPNPTHQMTYPTQPNRYQSENLDPGPNPTHKPTDPIKTTTNLLVQERQLSNWSREEIRDAPNYKFTKQFDANICDICLLTPWPSVSTTLVPSIN